MAGMGEANSEVRESPHFSTSTLDAGARLRKAPMVGKWATRSRSPGAVRLNWFRTDIDPDSIAWARDIDGDPKAGRLPRSWRNAAVLGVHRDALARLGAHDTEHGHYAKDAVAFVSEGVVRVGLNTDPESSHLFGGYGENGDMLTIAMQLGRGPLRAVMGQYKEEEGRLLVPEGIVVIEEHIPGTAIGPSHDPDAPSQYPHTRLAV